MQIININNEYLEITFDNLPSSLGRITTVESIINCNGCEKFTATVSLYTDKLEWVSGKLKIYPAFYDKSEFVDGIYYIKVTNNGWSEETCFFNDVETKCLLSAYLLNAIDDKFITDLYLVHYALTQGSNCACNCVKLCKLYKYLQDKLSNSIPEKHGCGCNK